MNLVLWTVQGRARRVLCRFRCAEGLSASGNRFPALSPLPVTSPPLWCA
jgi:hypothetical protein